MAESLVCEASPEFFQKLISSTESYADDKVCVIGIIGKGSFGHKSKARHVNSAIEKDLFKVLNSPMVSMSGFLSLDAIYSFLLSLSDWLIHSKTSTYINSWPYLPVIKLPLGFVEKFHKTSSNSISPCDIEIYHDVEQRIIYLHLESLFDASRLHLLCQQAFSGCSNSESHHYWKNQEYYHACAMLFMFSVCHIMLMIHPSTTFDLGYIRLFRTLASTRHQLLQQISHCLNSIDGLPEIWRQTGRPCIPRLICSFKQIVPFSALDPTTRTALHKDTYASRAKVKTQVNNSQRNLQNALQEQIYHLMRKARLLGSLSSSSLFTVSSGHSFVHVEPSSSTFDPVSIMLNKLAMPAIKSQWAESSILLKEKGMFKCRLPKDAATDSLTEDILFKDYLKQQIDNLMTGDAGRDGVAEGRRGTHVEVPRCRQWAQVCLSLYEFYMGKVTDALTPFITMASQLDLDMKFSEGRCLNVLPLASRTYLENLPSHYTRNVHLSQLAQALRLFALHARGPAYEHYATQLKEECNKIWTNGRQLCEERSLTGRHCVYPYHKVPEDILDKSKDDGSIPCKPHSSRITSLCACNCGRTQEHRDDPFDVRAANYDFFKVLEDKCCAYLLHLIFPCHPSFSLSKTPEISLKDAEILEEESLLDVATENKSSPVHEENLGGEVKESAQTVNDDTPVVPSHVSGIIPISKSAINTKDSKEPTGSHTTSSHIHTAGSHGQSSSSLFSLGGFHSILDTMSHEGTENEYKSVTSVGLGGEISTAGSEEPLSTVEPPTHVGDVISPQKKVGNEQAFLQTMLTDQSMDGVLPLFPSWSLCRLGSFTSYQPSKGLEQLGFFPGSNFLLAWDIPLSNENHADLTSQFDSQGKLFSTKSTSNEAWPAPNELPALAGSSPSLPLHQALSYSQRQCADMKANATQMVVSQNVSKGAATGGSTRSRGRNAREAGPPTVRAYIGNEYECPRGHRFICSGPDKMVKATTSGHVKESAHKLVTMDMPLYFPCPCRSSKPLLAQLARIYAATPDSPVLVSLNPRVQPAAPPCPVFHAGVGIGISLPPASLCVLRFPYVYVGADGPILPPGDSQPLLSCRLLKNVYMVTGRG